MVALGSATANGQTIFGKNSDRPADECQPLVQHPRRTHATGSITRCQFVELPEAPVTYRHVGSRPYWCWGYEHGFNEYQVVIGNEAVFSRFPESAEPKLIGMEIVRLGLERARTAGEAVQVMTDLVSRYGQGKFANAAGVMTYDNSYIVADPREAYVIETAGHEWTVRRVVHSAGISNLYTITTDWSSLSPTAEKTASQLGWWLPDAPHRRGRFDFARAYAVPRDFAAREALHVLAAKDTPWTAAGLARHISERTGLTASETEMEDLLTCRHDAPWRCARSNDLLAHHDGAISASTMMLILSDHVAGHAPGAPTDTTPSTQRGGICYHRAPDGRGGNTAASLVADLFVDGSRLPVYWSAFYSPCLALFLPTFIQGDLPGALSKGDATPSADSPWWQFRELSDAVYTDIETLGPRVRERWAPLQRNLLDTAYSVAYEGRRLIEMGKPEEASALLTQYMAENATKMLQTVSELRDELRQRPAKMGVAD